MRGAHTTRPRGSSSGRIIPADAGSTCGKDKALCNAWDHPRGCGEHFSAKEPNQQAQGSSPRMRGARCHASVDSAAMRIIPADAGSTSMPALTRSALKDHPRGCGEHSRLRASLSRQPGSSPRMRGAQQVCSVADDVLGIIPADAGSTNRFNPMAGI